MSRSKLIILASHSCPHLFYLVSCKNSGPLVLNSNFFLVGLYVRLTSGPIISDLVSAVNIYCLKHVLSSPNDSGLAFVDRLVLASIFHCSKDDNHVRAISELKAVFDCM